jgi:hypothetical protein
VKSDRVTIQGANIGKNAWTAKFFIDFLSFYCNFSCFWPRVTATTPYSPILSQNTKPVATTPINIWHFSWNQPKISLSLQCQNLD